MKKRIAALLSAVGMMIAGLLIVSAPQAQAGFYDCSGAYDGSNSLCVYTDINWGGTADYWNVTNPTSLSTTFKARISSVSNWSHTSAWCLYDRENHTGNKLIVDAWKDMPDLRAFNRTWWGDDWNDAVQSIKRSC